MFATIYCVWCHAAAFTCFFLAFSQSRIACRGAVSRDDESGLASTAVLSLRSVDRRRIRSVSSYG